MPETPDLLPSTLDDAPPAVPCLGPAAPPLCRSEDLLRGGRLCILHGGETYVLRLTKQGKLLLTK